MLSVLLSGLLLGAYAAAEFPKARGVEAANEGEIVKYIPFAEGNFKSEEWADTKYPTAADWVCGQYGTFWYFRYFGALDDFYDGNRIEEWTGTIESISWIQNEATPYVTFTLGGNVQDSSYVEIVDENGNNATTVEGGKIYNNKFSDPSLSVNMIVKVVEISPEYFNKPIHLELHDGKTGGFGMIEFGALSPNQSAEEVTNTLWHHGFGGQGTNFKRPDNSDPADSNYAAQEYVWNIYKTDSEYSSFMSEAIFPSKTKIVEGFESGVLSDDWVFDGNYGSWSDTEGGDSVYPYYDRSEAVSDRVSTNFCSIPFNKDGTYFLNGWKGEDGAADEPASYRLLSRPFTLTGTGLISAKLGGRTAQISLYSYDGNKPGPDAKPLVSYHNENFVDSVDVSNGITNVTMRRVYLDASAYLGQTVVLALEDYETGGNWAHAMFDSIDTNVDLADFKFTVDVVTQEKDGVSKRIGVTDIYRAGASKEGLANIKEAHAFLEDYYSTARGKGSLFTYCELPIDDLNRLVEGYAGLSTEAKAIVDRSDDFSYADYLNHKDIVDYEDDIVLTTVGQSMSNLNSIAETERNSTNGIFAVNQTLNGSSMAAISILAVLLIVGASLFVYLRIRKKKESK